MFREISRISLDAGTAHRYTGIRGGHIFEKTMNSITGRFYFDICSDVPYIDEEQMKDLISSFRVSLKYIIYTCRYRHLGDCLTRGAEFRSGTMLGNSNE